MSMHIPSSVQSARLTCVDVGHSRARFLLLVPVRISIPVIFSNAPNGPALNTRIVSSPWSTALYHMTSGIAPSPVSMTGEGPNFASTSLIVDSPTTTPRTEALFVECSRIGGVSSFSVSVRLHSTHAAPSGWLRVHIEYAKRLVEMTRP